MNNLPAALLKELPQYPEDRKKYNAKELVLAMLANATVGVTTKDMMIYVWQVNKIVMKRTYLYQMLYRLRREGLINTTRQSSITSGNGSRVNEGTKYYAITDEGRSMARPYIEVTS